MNSTASIIIIVSFFVIASFFQLAIHFFFLKVSS